MSLRPQPTYPVQPMEAERLPERTVARFAGTRCPEDVLTIPVHEQSPEQMARYQHQTRGQFLARQERWDDLCDEVRRADHARDTTPGGMPVSELLLFGARSDVVYAVEHALLDGTPPKDAPLLDGIAAFEALRMEYPNDPVIALIVALSHIDIAWAWRGAGWDAPVPKPNRRAFVAHMQRAEELLSPYCGIELDSPVLAAARCSLFAGGQQSDRQIADEYEDLIDLDPGNHRHMRAMGNHLLPRWFGSFQDLELEARRTAARTQDIWGDGGYTWVYFDAIAVDDEACALVDVDFFIDGLRDIIKTRPDQEMANLLCAFCAVAIHHGTGSNERADLNRIQIAECAKWLIRDHLTEVYPLVWAHAAEGFDNNARITSISRFAARGKADALQAICEQFREDIEAGLRITYTPDGPELHPG
ncbi:MAG: hypothetical protein AB3N23_05625 [Paracoccaceae bacterium]